MTIPFLVRSALRTRGGYGDSLMAPQSLHVNGPLGLKWRDGLSDNR
jgi:hypothetical protein